MAKIQLVLTGDRALNRKLRQLTGPQARKAISKAARVALKPVQREAKRTLPKRSGKLRKAVKVRAMKRSRSRIGARVTTGVDGSDFAGKAFYGAFLEFGWKSGPRKKDPEAIARKIAGGLRREARKARENGPGKGLAPRGSSFRARQEAYFSSEGQKAAAGAVTRKQQAGRRYLKRAAESSKAAALAIYQAQIVLFIRSLGKG